MKLNCSHNQLTSLDSLCECPELTKLWCDHNQLTSLEGCPIMVGELLCYANPLIEFQENIEKKKKLTLYQASLERITNLSLDVLGYLPFMIENDLKRMKMCKKCRKYRCFLQNTRRVMITQYHYKPVKTCC
jgi:hypothetical protein